MARKLVRSFSVLIILTILLAQFSLRPAAAEENFIVNSTADMLDAEPGDGLCEPMSPETVRCALPSRRANALPGQTQSRFPRGRTP